MRSLQIAVTLVLLAVTSASALAQEVSRAYGRGISLNRDLVKGHFSFEVVQRKSEGGNLLRGRLHFAAVNPERGRRVEIVIPNVDRFGVVEKVGEFTGNGSIRIFENGRLIAAERGRVSVRVMDRRDRKNPSGEPDTIRVRFTNDNRTFEYDGVVRDGDIVVQKRTR